MLCVVTLLNTPDVECQLLLELQKPSTRLEERVYTLLEGSPHVIHPNVELTQFEQECLESLLLDEALERRNDLAKIRALQSYQAAKQRRQNRIRSKK